MHVCNLQCTGCVGVLEPGHRGQVASSSTKQHWGQTVKENVSLVDDDINQRPQINKIAMSGLFGEGEN